MTDKKGTIEKGMLVTLGFMLIAFGVDTLKNWRGDYMQAVLGIGTILISLGLFAFWQFWTERQTAELALEIYQASLASSECCED